MWLSLVEHYVRDVGAAGSNPVIPTTSHRAAFLRILCFGKGFFFSRTALLFRPKPSLGSPVRLQARSQRLRLFWAFCELRPCGRGSCSVGDGALDVPFP